MQDDPASAPSRQPALERRLATIMMADVVGDMASHWNDDTISVTGAWSNNVPISATWKRVR